MKEGDKARGRLIYISPEAAGSDPANQRDDCSKAEDFPTPRFKHQWMCLMNDWRYNVGHPALRKDWQLAAIHHDKPAKERLKLAVIKGGKTVSN